MVASFQCQEVLFQYVEFLNNQLDAAAYSALVPSLHALCIRFGIEPAIAFYIARPKLVHTMKVSVGISLLQCGTQLMSSRTPDGGSSGGGKTVACRGAG